MVGWRIYKKHLEKVNEHEGVRLFGLMSHGPGVIQINVRAINCVEGMKGLTFRVGGGVAGNAAKSLGVTVMLASATKNYPQVIGSVSENCVTRSLGSG